jgi:hypothetical protein
MKAKFSKIGDSKIQEKTNKKLTEVMKHKTHPHNSLLLVIDITVVFILLIIRAEIYFIE